MRYLDTLNCKTFTPNHTFYNELVAMLFSVSNNLRTVGIYELLDSLSDSARSSLLAPGKLTASLDTMIPEDIVAVIDTMHQSVLYLAHPDFPFVLQSNNPNHSMLCFPTRLTKTIAHNGWPQTVELYLVSNQDISVINAQADELDILTETHFAQTMNGIIKAFFIKYYESQYPQIKQCFGTDRDKWPELWRFAWAVRNSFVHNGIRFDDPNIEPVSWEGFEYSRQDNGMDILAASDGLRMADIILLFDEIHRLLHA